MEAVRRLGGSLMKMRITMNTLDMRRSSKAFSGQPVMVTLDIAPLLRSPDRPAGDGGLGHVVKGLKERGGDPDLEKQTP